MLSRRKPESILYPSELRIRTVAVQGLSVRPTMKIAIIVHCRRASSQVIHFHDGQE